MLRAPAGLTGEARTEDLGKKMEGKRWKGKRGEGRRRV